MSINMDWRNTPYYKSLNDEERAKTRGAFETVGFAMLGCGIGPELTEKNFYEFWARCQIMSGVIEFKQTRELYAELTREKLRGYIGLRINMSTTPRGKWIKQLLDGVIMTAQYHDRQKEQSDAA
jgi:hypothetical protein